MKTDKRHLIEEMAQTMTNNWINSGDRPESDRESILRFHRRQFAGFTVSELREMVKNTTRVPVPV